MQATDLQTFPGICTTIFFIMNSIGQVPVFIALLKKYEPAHQRKIIIRELLITLFVLYLFIFCGSKILEMLTIDEYILGISGGILLFLISLEMIFPHKSSMQEMTHEPIVVPLAIPGLAGPGAMIAMIVYAKRYGILTTSSALFIAWIPAFLLILASSFVKKYLGEKGMQAVERLGGMIICLLGVKMLTEGIINLLKINL